MMWRKACPRCGGDLFLDSDLHGDFISCIQCGAVMDESQVRWLSVLARRGRDPGDRLPGRAGAGA